MSIILILRSFVNKEILKKTKFLVFIVYLCSCTSIEENQQGRYFTHIINQYFGEYQPNEKNWVDKPESKYSITKIKKIKSFFK
ncbi:MULTISPECIES: hypothetical protein [Acinetobacter]|uniref:Uncharacterized protein n=1 Tax=Acinetobacter higginsii TaxID=70347 RepID=N9RDA5_9GAMM|nr:hypothetical protein F902_03049 [Acinetobacter higginsii]